MKHWTGMMEIKNTTWGKVLAVLMAVVFAMSTLSLTAFAAGLNDETPEGPGDDQGISMQVMSEDLEEEGEFGNDEGESEEDLEEEEVGPEEGMTEDVEEGDETIAPAAELNEGVAKIGEDVYETLPTAIEAAQDGDTITLLADVTVNETYSSDASLEIRKGITIDGQGHTIACAKQFGIRIFGGDEGAEAMKVTLKNVTVTNAQDAGRAVETRGGNVELVLDNAILTTTGGGNTQAFTVGGRRANATNVTIKNGSKLSASQAGYGIITFNPVNMTINNSEVSGYGALYFKGENFSAGSASSTVNIVNDSSISSTGIAGSSNSFGTLVFQDNNITVNVKDSSLVATADPSKDPATPQAVILYSSYANPTGVVVNISGNSQVTTINESAAFVRGEETGNTISITGGTFSIDVSEYCVKNYVAVTSDDGKSYKVVSKKDAAVASVSNQNGTVLFTTVAEAINWASNGSTIKIIKDTNESIQINKNKNLTIDLNGNTLGNGDSDVTITNVGTLTIIDNSAEQAGMVKSTGADDAIDNYGTLNVESGSIVGGTAWYGIYAVNNSVTNINGTAKVCGEYWGIGAASAAEAGTQINVYGNAEVWSVNPAGTNGGISASKATINIYDNAVVHGACGINTEGNLTVSDNATITAEHASAGTAVGLYAGADVTINGGAITGGAYGVSGNGSSDGTTVVINGGEISGEGAGIYHPQAGTLTINGGKITGAVGVQMCDGELVINDAEIVATGADERDSKTGDGVILDGAAISLVKRGGGYGDQGPVATIVNGTFSSEQSEAVIVYSWSNNADDEWVVDGFVTGGAFSTDVSDQCPEGYGVAKPESSDFYTVHMHESSSVVTKDATCSTEGERTVGCPVDGCANKTVETIAIDSNAHAYGEWVVTTPAAAGVAGEQQRTCTRCGEVETQSISALPSNPQVNPGNQGGTTDNGGQQQGGQQQGTQQGGQQTTQGGGQQAAQPGGQQQPAQGAGQGGAGAVTQNAGTPATQPADETIADDATPLAAPTDETIDDDANPLAAPTYSKNAAEQEEGAGWLTPALIIIGIILVASLFFFLIAKRRKKDEENSRLRFR